MARWSTLLAATAATLLLIPSTAGAAGTPAPGGERAAPDKPIKVIIEYWRQPSAIDASRLRAKGASVRFRYRHVPAIAAVIPRSQRAILRAQPGIRRVQPDHKLTLFHHGAASGDPELERAWGVEHIEAGRAHLAGERGQGIRIAVADTGIDCSHPDLDDNCAGGISYIPSAPFPGGVPIDDYGHGTHVAGSIAAEQSGDSSGVVGVAPRAKLVAFKVLDSTGQGDYSGLIAALDQVTTWNLDANPANDIDVVNMSLGGHETSDPLHDAVIAARASGAILVAASGNVNPFDFNELINGCPVAYPAAFDEVLSTTFTDGNDALTGYSCTGPEVDYAAPGDNVYSTVSLTGPMGSATRYGTASGTSMASPHLAGTVALVLSHGIADSNGNGRLDDEVKAHLCDNTTPGYGVLSTPIPQNDPRYPKYFGCGVVNAGKALVDDPPGDPPPNEPPSASAGGPYAGDEGASVALDAGASDTEGDTLSRSWTWEAGAGVDPGATCTFANPSIADTSVSCTDDGEFTLSFTVNDGSHPDVTDTTTLTLSNVAPSVSIDSPSDGASFEVGQDVTVTRSVSDPGSNDGRSCSIDWGDGSATTPCGQNTHAYAAEDPDVTITVTATDDDDDDGSASVTIEVTTPPPPNEPPSANAGGPYAGDEGDSVALDAGASDTEGDTLSRSWTWEAGAGVDPGATCTFANPSIADTSVSCTDDGEFTLSFTVNDGSHPDVTDTATLTLSNVAPEVTIASPLEGVDFDTGATVTLARTVSDPGSNDGRSCSIDWGDGSATTPCGQNTHVYPAEAPDVTITVTVTDDDGAAGSDSVTIGVFDPPPPVVDRTFTPIADAQVYATQPTTNFGTLNRVRVRASTYRSYLRFRVTGVTAGTVVAAKLRLYVSDGSDAAGTVRVVATNTWGEMTINWSNKPAQGAVLSSRGRVVAGTWVEFDLDEAITRNGTFSFVLTGGSTDVAAFHSREGALDPVLVVSVQP